MGLARAECVLAMFSEKYVVTASRWWWMVWLLGYGARLADGVWKLGRKPLD